MNDPSQIVYEWLTKTGTDLYREVADRVTEGLLHAGFTNTEKRIVFVVEVGTPESPVGLISNMVSARCYGGTNSEADASSVARALYNRFVVDTRKAPGRVSTGRLLRARCVMIAPGPPEEVEGGQSWPVHLVRIEVITE